MVSVTNPLMDSEIWGANLAGKCVVCRSNKAVAPHPTISAVPLPDATLARLIRPCIIPPVQRKSASFLCLQSACRIGPWVLTCCVPQMTAMILLQFLISLQFLTLPIA